MNKTLRTLAQAVIVAIGLLGASTGAASAADLVLDCRMTETWSNGSQTTYTRRFEITFDVRSTTAVDNKGSGFGKPDTFPLIRADNERIVVRDDAEAYHEINRRTGVFYAAPKTGNAFVMRGQCVKVDLPPVKF